MVGGAVSSKTMREAALYLTGFQRRDIYEVSIELTPEVATERLRRRTDHVVEMMTESAVGEPGAATASTSSTVRRTLGPDRSVVVHPAEVARAARSRPR